ncbi:hypothetical protein OC834_001982 [Tilletia horrida]|nr:hypothetical protein OC834_001982 [Tilletia horrida]KAK0566373.1 hypothetical protein OC844_000773 [Tilletia horrida]
MLKLFKRQGPNQKQQQQQQQQQQEQQLQQQYSATNGLDAQLEHGLALHDDENDGQRMRYPSHLPQQQQLQQQSLHQRGPSGGGGGFGGEGTSQFSNHAAAHSDAPAYGPSSGANGYASEAEMNGAGAHLQQQHDGAHLSLYPNPYGPDPADSQRPFSPEAAAHPAHVRSESPAGAGGVHAYESYSEQHDSVPAPHALKGKGAGHGHKLGFASSGGGGSGGAAPNAKVEKPKRGILGGGGGGAQNLSDITEKIAWLCGSPNSTVDFSHVLSLADSISSSEAAAKEAARAIRKEFKYGEPEAQRRAIRVWAILMINASDRFRMQIATKRFLEVVDHVATSKNTDPGVSAKMFDVLAVLAYTYQFDADLSMITRCWNKIKPKDRPLNGEPLDPESPDFNPPVHIPRSPRGAPQRRAVSPNGDGQERERDPNGNGNGTGNGNGLLRPSQDPPRKDSGKTSAAEGKKKPRDYSHRIVSADEDMRKLHEECDIARINAGVLIDSLASSGLSSPLLDEFAHKVQLSQMFLVGQIDWASAQANRSRDYMNDIAAVAVAEGRQPPLLEETREERLLADILSANERLMEAQQMLDDARLRQKEEEEEEAARERSRVETRYDRNAAAALDMHSNPSGGSGSGAPAQSFGSGSSGSAQLPAAASAVAGSLSLPPTNGPSQLVAEPGSIPQHARGPLPKTPPALQRDPSPLPQIPMQAPISLTGISGTGAGEEDDIQTPIVPSEKALGKRRAFSDRGDAFDSELQARALAEQAPVHVPVKLHEVLEQDDATI